MYIILSVGLHVAFITEQGSDGSNSMQQPASQVSGVVIKSVNESDSWPGWDQHWW